MAIGQALEIPTAALRLFNVYGSRQALSNPYTGVAAIFISRLLNDEAPLIFEDRRQTRDFVHVHDVAAAFVTVLESDMRLWDAFNVGSGRGVAVLEITSILARLLHKNISPDILEQYCIGDTRHCVADIPKIDKEFGFRPRHRLEDGMKELIDWVATATKPTASDPSNDQAVIAFGAL